MRSAAPHPHWTELSRGCGCWRRLRCADSRRSCRCPPSISSSTSQRPTGSSTVAAQAALVSDAFVSGDPVGVPRHRIAADDPPHRRRAAARAAADDHGCRTRTARRARAGRAGGVDRRRRPRRRVRDAPRRQATRLDVLTGSSSRTAPPASPTPSSIQPSPPYRPTRASRSATWPRSLESRIAR